jgi:hypothetical protein
MPRQQKKGNYAGEIVWGQRSSSSSKLLEIHAEDWFKSKEKRGVCGRFRHFNLIEAVKD